MSHKPKPAAVKRATGNPGKRRVPKELDFAAGDNLAAPKDWPAKGYERKEWARIVPELQRLGVAKSVHQGILEMICELYASAKRLRKQHDEVGARMQAAEYRKALNEFGLTAASAGKVGSNGANDDHKDPAEEFFGGPRLERTG